GIVLISNLVPIGSVGLKALDLGRGGQQLLRVGAAVQRCKPGNTRKASTENMGALPVSPGVLLVSPGAFPISPGALAKRPNPTLCGLRGADLQFYLRALEALIVTDSPIRRQQRCDTGFLALTEQARHEPDRRGQSQCWGGEPNLSHNMRLKVARAESGMGWG